MKAAAISVAIILAGCQSMSRPAPEVDRAVTLDGDFVALAQCAYINVEKRWPANAGITDLSTQDRMVVYAATGDLRYWEAFFTPEGDGKTRVEIRGRATMFGDAVYADKVLPDITACA